MIPTEKSRAFDRRQFIKAGGAAAAIAAPFIGSSSNAADGQEILRVGLIGCGGRGSGAATQALKADKGARLVAMCDIFPDRLDAAYDRLKKIGGDQVQIPKENRFSGFDGYQKLLDLGVDVVLLASPPGFRPTHLAAAAKKGVHVFCEKPIAVDVPGVHSVIESCRILKEKRKSLVSGLCWRYEAGIQETIKRIQDGAIGEVLAMEATTMGGGLWERPLNNDMSQVEKQVRNWNKWIWLCGDVYLESHIHSLDMAAWVLGDIGVKEGWGMGGRQQPRPEGWGNIFDHHAVNMQFANGVALTTYSRNQPGSMGHYDVHVIGTKGEAWTRSKRIISKDGNWRHRGKVPNMYQVEHNKLFAAIRNNEPIANGHYMTNSNMIGLLGRTASYTGQKITWDQIQKSTQRLGPEKQAWGDHTPQPIPIPGQTQFS